jgi:hypothetical protein
MGLVNQRAFDDGERQDDIREATAHPLILLSLLGDRRITRFPTAGHRSQKGKTFVDWYARAGH